MSTKAVSCRFAAQTPPLLPKETELAVMIVHVSVSLFHVACPKECQKVVSPKGCLFYRPREDSKITKEMIPPGRFQASASQKAAVRVPSGFQRLHKFSSTSRPLYRHRLMTKTYHNTGKTMIPPGFEPGTACVLDRSDNQLHHRTNC